MKIDSVSAQQILDTRDRPTIEVTLISGETIVHASVPSGKSTGSHEAVELRDADGGVSTAIGNVECEIAALVTGRQWETPDELDAAMIALDGTPNKSRLGANAILGVSIAAQRLAAELAGVPLWRAIALRAGTTPAAPRLYLNFMNGGEHADYRLPFQEYLFVVGGKTSEAMPIAERVFKKLGERLERESRSSTSTESVEVELLQKVPMGDEGGYSPKFEELDKPFELLAALVAEHPGASIAIDAAANALRNDHGGYTLIGRDYTPDELRALYLELISKFPFHSIEDPFAETATEDFTKLTAEAGEVIIVGDDLTVTNPARIEMAREAGAITAVLIKPNQIGSVKEAIEAVQMTHANGWAAVCSHRSGETDDTFIADFAYAVGAHGIKAGGLGQKERREKYERLLEIEKEAETV